MKHLQSYEIYTLNESVSLELLLEDKKINFYRITHDKIVNKLSLQLYFVGTFQMGITVLYPIVESLTKNTPLPNMVTAEQIVLMTIFSIAQILRFANEDTKKIKEELQKNNLIETTEKVTNSIRAIFKIVTFVSRSFGKVIDVFTDMLAYVGLCVPIYSVIIEIISKDGLNLDTLPQKILILGASTGVFAVKSLIETIVILVKNKLKKNINITS